MKRSAVISGCGQFRYHLSRNWTDEDAAILLFVMLNPSTADAETDDPTIRKCIGFADRLRYGAIEVVNLFAYRATDPRALKAAGYPVGPENDGCIAAAARRATDVVCAWGANARGLARPAAVLGLLQQCGVRPKYLHKTADGIPSHPLMLPYSCTMENL